MPRAFVSRTTFVFATASLFPTLAYAGHVPVVAYEVVAERCDVRAPVGEVPPEEDGGDEGLSYVSMDAGTFASRGPFEIDSIAPQPAILTSTLTDAPDHSPVEGAVAVPLPGPMWTGIIGLGAAAWAKGRVKRRGRKAARRAETMR
jgi:hypothetical protein